MNVDVNNSVRHNEKRRATFPGIAVCRVALGIVFLYASFGKILDPRTFAGNLLEYQILDSAVLIRTLAAVLPWVEWFCGIFLILGVFVRSASFLSTTLLVTFLISMIQAKVRGLDINCGCFDAGKGPIGAFTLARDSLFLLMSLVVFKSAPDPYSLQAWLTDRSRRRDMAGDSGSAGSSPLQTRE